MKKQNQKGALLVEVIAVLGLIALITPILFHQLQRRNEEIIDAQIASEVRAIKDALSAYIQANEDIFAEDCGLVYVNEKTGEVTYLLDQTDERGCNIEWDDEEKGNVSNYANADISGILSDYNVVFYGKNVSSKVSPEDGRILAVRPSIYAIAYKTDPEPSLRRASKVAAMVGVEGGVAAEVGKVSGMNGVWVKDINDVPKNAVAVTTAFEATTNSAILKDAKFSHVKGESVYGTNVAAENLGATGIFSVGDSSCVVGVGTDAITIREKGTYTDKGTTTTCAPVFEVNTATKEVHVAGVIRTGQPVDGASCSSSTTKDDCEATANCVWVSQPTEADPNAKGCVAEYILDPANISVVNDIKLSSRGGAKLSDILPKWSLMNVKLVKSGSRISPSGDDVYKCPTGYNKGLILIPSKFNRAGTGTFTVGYTSNGGNVAISISSDDKEEVIVQEYCVFD